MISATRAPPQPTPITARNTISPFVFLAVIGVGCGGALVALIIYQMIPRQVTRDYWYVREEIRMMERDIGGKKVIVPFQTKPAEQELRPEKVMVTPTFRDYVILGFFAVILLAVLIFLGVCVNELKSASRKHEEPPEWAKTWTNNLVSGLAGALFGFLGAQSIPDPARTANAAAPSTPPATVAKP
jgi:hypothetical protein